MKIECLEMSAFGPFKGVETIDFKAINTKRIFLISGPTGAGKTTIFDAISFALYGKASGSNRSDPENVRSDFAHVDTVTYVKLVFTIRDNTYEIIRYPKQERPSRRNTDDLVSVPHKAEIHPVSDPGAVLTRVSDVNDKVIEILGISYDQFRQIVMLPQGEFQALLLASSDERTKIFRRIFNTDFFERFQERLKDQADTMKRAFTDEQTKLTSYYRQIVTRDSDTELKRIIESDNVHVDFLLEELSRINGESSRFLKQNRKEETVLQNTIEDKKTRIRAVEYNNEKLAQRKEARRKRQELMDEKEAIDHDREKVERYDQALRVKPLRDRVKELGNNKNRYMERAKMASDRLTELKREFEGLKKDYVGIPELQKEIDVDKAGVERLERMIEHMKADRDKKRQEQACETKIEAQETILKQANIEREKLEKEIEDVNRNMTEDQELLSETVDLIRAIQAKEQQIGYDRQVLDLYDELEAYDKDVAQERVRYEQVHQTFVEKEKAFREKTRRYLNGQATLLSESLEEGEPCPVCGSVHHPHKAKKTGETISHADHEANKEAYENDLARYRAAEKRFERLKEKRDHTHTRLDETLQQREYDSSCDRESLSKNMNTRKDELKTLYEKQNAMIETEHEFKRLKATMKTYEARHKAMIENKNEILNVIARLNGEKSRIREDRVRLERELAGESRPLEELESTCRQIEQEKNRKTDSIQSLRESYRTTEQKIEYEQKNLTTINKEIDDNEQTLIQANRDYQDVLLTHFSSEEELDRSLESDHKIEDMKKRVKSHDDALLQNRQWLDMIEKEITAQDMCDAKPLKDEVNELESEQRKIREVIRESDLRHARNTELERLIEKTYRSGERARKAYEKMQEIANIARGMRGNKISFERYVLAFFFNEILNVANKKLAKMTNERYTLLRKAKRMKGSSQQGLDLVIHDAYTTKTRDVSTLSGGESFKAALALALGLAEIVERNAGGISLETMFIDEGFGTLDAESLDMAVETLLNLNRTGRVVGIISHVQELKDRIDAKITLEVTNEGSRIQ